MMPEYDICVSDRVGARADRHDAVTVVLPSRGHVRFAGRLRAPRVVAVTFVVLGAGISIRLFRHPSESGEALRSQPRTRVSARQGAARRRRRVDRRQGPRGRIRVVSRTPISDARARRVPSTGPEGDVPQVLGVPEVDDAPVRRRPEVQAPAARRRPPCVPGTLGC
jgi:hypothetical protein